MKVSVIEVDDSIDLQGGTVIAFRAPALGEAYVGPEGKLRLCDAVGGAPHLIVRLKPAWPYWLPGAGALAKNGNDEWRAFESPAPKYSTSLQRWMVPLIGNNDMGYLLDPELFDMSNFPDCLPEESLWVNPRHRNRPDATSPQSRALDATV